MDNSIQPPQPPQLNTKKGKIAQFFGELSKSRRIALIVVVLIAALGAGWLVFSKAAVEPRDVTQQPFSRWSIWNMPIGSSAKYDGGEMPSGYRGGTVQSSTWTVATFTAKSSDPKVNVNTSEDGSVNLYIPNNATSSGDTDGLSAIIQPDGLTAYEFYDFKGNTAQLYRKVNLTGTGQATGYPRAAQTSALGGLIRKSDWDKGVINHSLAIAIPRGALKSCSYIWPAISEDDGDCGSGYAGSVRMGSLIAIPNTVDISSLGLSKDGLMIAKALQDYGGYVVDSADAGGIKLYGEYPSLDDGRLQDAANDMSKITPKTKIVSNSSPNSIGGGGNPRVCYASPVGNDANIPNPNGNVTQPAGCENGTTPPPAPGCPAGQVKDASGNCVPEMSGNSSKGSIAFYGDSLTGDDYWKGYIGNGLNQALTQAGFSQVYSKGCGGMSMAHFVGAESAEDDCMSSNTLEAHKADIAKSNTVVVAFYSNDYASSKDEFKANAQTALNKIKEYNSGIKNIAFIKGYFGGNEQFNEAFNELASADPNIVKVLDINGAFSNDYNANCRNAGNQDHPTDTCSTKMATEIATKLGGITPPPPTQPCPAGQTRVNGTCQPNEPDADCSKVNGQCVTPEPTCPSGQVKVNGKCVTPDSGNTGNTGNTGNASNNSNSCPSGQVKVNGVCKPIASTQEYKPAGTYNDDVATYSSGWSIGQDTDKHNYFNDSDHYTNKANETMTFKFKGVNVKIYGVKDSNMGTAKVTIDGGAEAIVNYYSANEQSQALIYDSGELSDDNHTLVLKTTGEQKKLSTITTASFNSSRQLATDGHDPEAETYISVDKIVVASKAVTSDNCPNGQVKVDGVCKTPDPGGNCPSGQVKVDGECVTPEITCPAGQSVVNGVCKDTPGKGSEPQKKVDTEISKKPEAKTVAEKLVNTGRFLLLPAIVAVLIILVAGGLYVVTKKKK